MEDSIEAWLLTDFPSENPSVLCKSQGHQVEVTPNGGENVGESAKNPLNSGLGSIAICPEELIYIYLYTYIYIFIYIYIYTHLFV